MSISGLENELDDEVIERIELLRSYDLDRTALKRYIESESITIDDKVQSLEIELAQKLSGAEFNDLINQFKYAGQQTVNYYVITGIEKDSLDELKARAKDNFPEHEEVEGMTKRPFFADSEIIDSRLYVSLGYFEVIGGTNPITNERKEELTPSRAILVVWDESDLVEIRSTDTTVASRVKETVANMQNLRSEENYYKPNMGSKFQEEFNELVDKYTNLRVRIDDKEGSTIDNIQFTSKADEKGSRKDARKDKRVDKELNQRGGEITMGYVEMDNLASFHINRKQSKISFRKCEREDKLNEITEIIHDVLKETGGYSQRKLRNI